MFEKSGIIGRIYRKGGQWECLGTGHSLLMMPGAQGLCPCKTGAAPCLWARGDPSPSRTLLPGSVTLVSMGWLDPCLDSGVVVCLHTGADTELKSWKWKSSRPLANSEALEWKHSAIWTGQLVSQSSPSRVCHSPFHRLNE